MVKLLVKDKRFAGEIGIQAIVFGNNVESTCFKVTVENRGQVGYVFFDRDAEIITYMGVYTDTLLAIVDYINTNIEYIRKYFGVEPTKPVINKDINPIVSKSKYLGKHRFGNFAYEVYYREDLGIMYFITDNYEVSMSTKVSDFRSTVELSNTEIRLLLAVKDLLLLFSKKFDKVDDNLTFWYRPTNGGIKFFVYRDNTYCTFNVDCEISQDNVSVLTFGDFMLKEIKIYKNYLEKALCQIKNSNLKGILEEV